MSSEELSPIIRNMLNVSNMNLTLNYLDDFLPGDGHLLDGSFKLILLAAYSTICVLGLITNIILISVILGT